MNEIEKQIPKEAIHALRQHLLTRATQFVFDCWITCLGDQYTAAFNIYIQGGIDNVKEFASFYMSKNFAGCPVRFKIINQFDDCCNCVIYLYSN